LAVADIAARLPSGMVSKATPMRILIEDPKPLLIANPKVIRLNEVVKGTRMRPRRVELTNTGNAPYRGPINLPKGWEVVGLSDKGTIEIAPGATGVVGFRFQATETGFTEQFVELQAGIKETTVELAATCVDIFAITPARVDLEWDSDTRQRSGKVLLRNRTHTAQTLSIVADKRMVRPTEVVLAPKEEKEIEVILPQDDIEAFTGSLGAKFAGTELSIALHATATPPDVSLVDPDPTSIIDFGSHTEGHTDRQRIVVKNFGGTEAFINPAVLPPFSIAEADRGGIRVASAEEASFEIIVKGELPGTFNRDLHIKGGGANLRIPVTVTIDAIERETVVEGTTGIILTPNKRPEKIEETEIRATTGETLYSDPMNIPFEVTSRVAFETLVGVSPFDTRLRDGFPRIGQLFYVNSTRDAITFGFDTIQDARSYIAEYAVVGYNPKTQLINKRWIPLQLREIEMEFLAEKIHVTMRGLPANATREIRVIPLFEDQEFGRASLPVFFSTKPPSNIPWRWIFVAVLALIAIGGYLWQRDPERAESARDQMTGLTQRLLAPFGRVGGIFSKAAQRRGIEDDLELPPISSKSGSNPTDSQVILTSETGGFKGQSDQPIQRKSVSVPPPPR